MTKENVQIIVIRRPLHLNSTGMTVYFSFNDHIFLLQHLYNFKHCVTETGYVFYILSVCFKLCFQVREIQTKARFVN